MCENLVQIGQPVPVILDASQTFPSEPRIVSLGDTWGGGRLLKC